MGILEEKVILDEYEIPLYRIEILSVDDELYYIVHEMDRGLEFEKANKLLKKFFSRRNSLMLSIGSLDDLIDALVTRLRKHVDLGGERIVRAKIYTYFSGINKILPLLLDDRVQEIYINSPNHKVYIDHQLYGRLFTNIILSDYDLSALMSFFRLYGGLFITAEKPSDKIDLLTKEFAIRVSVDTKPLVENITVTIRKIVQQDVIFPQLINQNNPYCLVFLLVLALFRRNMLIVGEPGSGKTTLVSFIIDSLPEYWRIISIEDVREIRVSRKNFLRYRVAPFESRLNEYLSKESQILRLLHRSPDYIVIGEVQDKNDAVALMHALSAGLKGIATMHSTSIHELFDRFYYTFHIDYSRLNLIDVIIIMKKEMGYGVNRREISSIFINTNMFEETEIDSNKKIVFERDVLGALINNNKRIRNFSLLPLKMCEPVLFGIICGKNNSADLTRALTSMLDHIRQVHLGNTNFNLDYIRRSIKYLISNCR